MMILSLSTKHLRSGFIFSFISPVSHTSSNGERDCSVWCHGLNYSQSVDASVSLVTGSGTADTCPSLQLTFLSGGPRVTVWGMDLDCWRVSVLSYQSIYEVVELQSNLDAFTGSQD